MTSVSKRSSNLFFALVVIGIILSSFLLTSTLPILPVFGSNNWFDSSQSNGSNGNNGDNSNGEGSGPCLSAEGAHKLSETPIFEIQGLTQTPYILLVRAPADG